MRHITHIWVCYLYPEPFHLGKQCDFLPVCTLKKIRELKKKTQTIVNNPLLTDQFIYLYSIYTYIHDICD